MKKKLRYLSLFTGIGGFELGLIQAAIGRAELECIGYSEIDKYATQIYQKHFPEHHNYRDITKINEAELPDFDILMGGFPCQAFSIAGKRKGFDDTRGTLFFDIARLIKAKRPRLLLLENVKGLLSHDDGRTFKTIIATLDELGYDLQWQVLNSKNHGVPQNRERVLIVGNLGGTRRPKVFPFGQGDAEHPDQTNEQGCASTLTGRSAGGQNRRGNYVVGTLRTHKDGEGFREVKSGLAPTIPARAREDGSGQPVILVREATRKGYAEATIGDSINLSVPNSKTRRGRVGGGHSSDARHRDAAVHPERGHEHPKTDPSGV
jgi:DNA (cytosine-5)-methyltransferase 1